MNGLYDEKASEQMREYRKEGKKKWKKKDVVESDNTVSSSLSLSWDHSMKVAITGGPIRQSYTAVTLTPLLPRQPPNDDDHDERPFFCSLRHRVHTLFKPARLSSASLHYTSRFIFWFSLFSLIFHFLIKKQS